MSTSLYAPDFLTIFNGYRDTGGPLQTFSSPADWRDQWDLLPYGRSLQQLPRASAPFTV